MHREDAAAQESELSPYLVGAKDVCSRGELKLRQGKSSVGNGEFEACEVLAFFSPDESHGWNSICCCTCLGVEMHLSRGHFARALAYFAGTEDKEFVNCWVPANFVEFKSRSPKVHRSRNLKMKP